MARRLDRAHDQEGIGSPERPARLSVAGMPAARSGRATGDGWGGSMDGVGRHGRDRPLCFPRRRTLSNGAAASPARRASDQAEMHGSAWSAPLW
jgi:hypothetical protein